MQKHDHVDFVGHILLLITQVVADFRGVWILRERTDAMHSFYKYKSLFKQGYIQSHRCRPRISCNEPTPDVTSIATPTSCPQMPPLTAM